MNDEPQWRFVLRDDSPNEAFVVWPNGYAAVHGSRAGREQRARLIAAAPDLLSALQGICDEQDARQGYASLEAYDKARAAIAKATDDTA